MSQSTLKILLVEDSQDDQLLIERELQRGGLDFVTKRVDRKEDFVDSLKNDSWDIVISDYVLPGFGGLEALTLHRRLCPKVPFIIVSGTVGEEVAVESIKAGADDYLLKQNLIRLVSAVQRALREAEERRIRERAEENLRESREQMELIYNSVSDFLVLISCEPNSTFIVRRVNSTLVNALKNSGFPVKPEDFINCNIDEIASHIFAVDEATVLWFSHRLHQAIQDGEIFQCEREFDSATGALIGEFNFTPILGEDEHCRNILVVARDVTTKRVAEQEQKRVVNQMLTAQKLEALGTLAGGIAHEFNNLLTGVLGFADLARKSDKIDDVRSYAEEIHVIGLRARELVQQILSFARRQPLQRSNVQISSIVFEILPMLQAVLPKSIEIVTQIPAVGPRVAANAGQIHQLLLNLCTNAAHAMPNGGRLTLAIEVVALDEHFCKSHPELKPGLHGKLSVIDTGIGMDDVTLQRVFEPFFTTKPVGLGTGLGMSVVHGIVVEHGGGIQVQSELEKGCRFDIFLPVVGLEFEDKATELPKVMGQ